MELLNSYQFIAAASIVVIISYFFNVISQKTNVPSVLLLIIFGILIKLGLDQMGAEEINYLPILEVLGTVGLIMIVLEAALDLDIEKEKLPTIVKALMVALLGLIGASFACAGIIQYFVEGMTFIKALLYAIPLAILSSAIIIPSVEGLLPAKREFMVYESAFSDILGIMFFYYIIGIEHSGSIAQATQEFGIGFIIISIISIVASMLLVVGFQNIKSHVKLFLLISILLLLYAVGKMLHLSPLLLILVFGLVLTNYELFFRGPLEKYANPDRIEDIEKDFHIITIETAFLIRTFFFVVFGMSIVLNSLASFNVFIVSMLILIALYLIRFISLAIFVRKDMMPELSIAPRGLITVLLFYKLDSDEHIRVEEFEPGILLFVIFISSVIMTFGLIADARKRAQLGIVTGGGHGHGHGGHDAHDAVDSDATDAETLTDNIDTNNIEDHTDDILPEKPEDLG